MVKHLNECDYQQRIDLAGGENRKYARQVDILISEIKAALSILELAGVCTNIIAKNLQAEEAMSELLTYKGLSE